MLISIYWIGCKRPQKRKNTPNSTQSVACSWKKQFQRIFIWLRHNIQSLPPMLTSRAYLSSYGEMYESFILISKIIASLYYYYVKPLREREELRVSYFLFVAGCFYWNYIHSSRWMRFCSKRGCWMKMLISRSRILIFPF